MSALDWSEIPGTEVELIYPGQVALQWLLSPSHHKGAMRFRSGQRECLDCHAWNLPEIGRKILLSPVLDSAPLQGRRSSTSLQVRMRVEEQQLQVRLTWQAAAGEGPQQRQTGVENRVTLLFDDDRIRAFARAGCWAACHADSRQMPEAVGQQKYLIHTRALMDLTGGGEKLRPETEIGKAFQEGRFLEFWQASLTAGKVVSVRNGHLLEKWHDHPDSAVSVDAEFAAGQWTVTFSRALDGGEGSKQFGPDTTYTFGIALHDQFTAGRYHLVSYPYTFRISGDRVTVHPRTSR